MCGIAGIIDATGRTPARPILERMSRMLTHRGPDEEGFFSDSVASFCHRRLSIIDLSGGRQPMANEAQTICVTFNGEVYNFQEIRKVLEGLGHSFATHSDTEVIVHAYEQYGPDCVRHFRGMFAFAVWDAPRRTLFLARDRVGKKPLFYAVLGDQLVFASELQALIQHPDIRRTPAPSAIDDYLTYGYIPAPQTVYQGVLKLPPAHYLTFRLRENEGQSAELRVVRYWQLDYEPKQTFTEEQAKAGLLEVLTEAVQLRLIADVPLGALLSGGIDSSLVVALMSSMSSQPVKTFSIGFEDREFDELPYARNVAKRYGTDHHEFIVRPDALDVLPKLVRHYGEPFADSSAIPSYYVSKLTRQHVTVALNGDGGDESFAGYERYAGSLLADRMRRWLPSGVLRGANALADMFLPNSGSRRNRLSQAKRLLQGVSNPTARRYLQWMSYLSPTQKKSLYTPEFASQVGNHKGEAWFIQEYEIGSKGGNSLDALLALDVNSYLPYDLLVKMDIATMACSLEARSPLLDHKVMEFAARLPTQLKIRGKCQKYLLKEIARDLLPAENLSRRKMGFGVPVANWMRKELRPVLEDLLLSPSARTRCYFQHCAVKTMVFEHVQGQHDHSYPLWALLCLELWHREFPS